MYVAGHFLNLLVRRRGIAAPEDLVPGDVLLKIGRPLQRDLLDLALNGAEPRDPCRHRLGHRAGDRRVGAVHIHDIDRLHLVKISGLIGQGRTLSPEILLTAVHVLVRFPPLHEGDFFKRPGVPGGPEDRIPLDFRFVYRCPGQGNLADLFALRIQLSDR